VTLAGVSQETKQAELDTWAASILDETVRTLPDDLVAHTVQHSGHPGPRVVRELERGGCDLIVLGTRGRGTREKEEALSWQMTTRTSTE
jgi:nucleotide-binding universal stress UspA family protein